VNAKEGITPQQKTKERRRTNLSSVNTADFAESILLIKKRNKILYLIPAVLFKGTALT
jgi:hypothetical protein